MTVKLGVKTIPLSGTMCPDVLLKELRLSCSNVDSYTMLHPCYHWL